MADLNIRRASRVGNLSLTSSARCSHGTPPRLGIVRLHDGFDPRCSARLLRLDETAALARRLED